MNMYMYDDLSSDVYCNGSSNVATGNHRSAAYCDATRSQLRIDGARFTSGCDDDHSRFGRIGRIGIESYRITFFDDSAWSRNDADVVLIGIEPREPEFPSIIGCRGHEGRENPSVDR